MEPVEFTVDGDTLYGDLHLPRGPASKRHPLVVLVHGMNSHRVEWYDFPRKLALEGWAAMAIDLRGHGQSTGDRGVQSVPRATADLQGAFAWARAHPRLDADTAALIGHSLGASLSVCAAAHLPIRALVTLAPPNRLSDEISLFSYLGYTLLAAANLPVRALYRPGLRVPRIVDYTDIYVDPAAVQRGRRDDFLSRTIPVQNYMPLMVDLDTEACAKHVTVPTLVLTAALDVVVGKWNSRRVYRALAGPKEFHEVPRSGHSMQGDRNSEVVVRHVADFLRRHMGATT